jgi:hypothetical protein
MFCGLVWSGAPAPGPWPSLLGPESCACAESASNDMAETKGMMIFMRLDAVMRACPLLSRLPWFPRDTRFGSRLVDAG